ncbi:MAG: hypothetical protein JSW43_13415 [Gemmatimonadota bacterium]|nr:MAG: hypothetical protein JSW43_13415 [Gemmatimonadota bacterium]
MRVLRVLVLLACSAGVLAAQETVLPSPESLRDVQLRQLELQRTMLLAMADSMPEGLYRDKVTPVQRDFAQQIHHAASSTAFISARYMTSERPSLPDTAVALNSREGLTGYINAVYDFATQVLTQQSEEDRAVVTGFFGGLQIPKWQIWDELHQHTVWTAGQVVANFRKHGMAPPGFGFF